ncbi:DUF4232 domain-containing protein [Frankia sp. R82]|nr:DUF4232 domain-containing protein [Frankia sp. R82]
MYHTGMDLVLTNVSARSCVTGGFPGVSVVDGTGRQIGAAADRVGSALGAIMLSPGQHATSTVVIAHTAAVMGGCRQPGQLAAIAALRIYPPAGLAALTVPYADTHAVHNEGCMDPTQHDLTVTALTR